MLAIFFWSYRGATARSAWRASVNADDLAPKMIRKMVLMAASIFLQISDTCCTVSNNSILNVFIEGPVLINEMALKIFLILKQCLSTMLK